MKIDAVAVCALGFLMAAGCDRLEEVVDLGHKAQEETRRERDRQQVEERQQSLAAERDSLQALIAGKMAVLSNRVAVAEVALRELQADRTALSGELSVQMGGSETNGAGLERALASPVVNALAMKYLQMDFSVMRGEYAEAIAKARECEADFRKAARKLDETYEESLGPKQHDGQSVRQSRLIADLEREHAELERKRDRLTRLRLAPANQNAQNEHDRQMRDLDLRLREIKRQVDKLKTGDERERKDADRIAENMRHRASVERNLALEKLKKEYKEKTTVLETVRVYGEKTLQRLERALVKKATDLEAAIVKSREGCLTLRGIGSSVPRLSADGLKKLQRQVSEL